MTIWLLYWGVLKVVVKGREIQGRRAFYVKAELELTTYALAAGNGILLWDRSLGVFMFMYILINVKSLFRGCTISGLFATVANRCLPSAFSATVPAPGSLPKL